MEKGTLTEEAPAPRAEAVTRCKEEAMLGWFASTIVARPLSAIDTAVSRRFRSAGVMVNVTIPPATGVSIGAGGGRGESIFLHPVVLAQVHRG